MAVIATGEFQKITAAGVAARKADGAHRRFRAGIAQAHHLHRRHTGNDGFGKCRFRFRRCAEAETACRRFLYRTDNGRVGMADNGRTIRADIVDIAFAVHIKNIRPLGAGDKARRAADTAESADGRIDPARNNLLRGEKSILRRHGKYLENRKERHYGSTAGGLQPQARKGLLQGKSH